MSNVKACFIKKPILVLLDPEELFILETDASDYALNACLGQMQEGKLYIP